LVQNEPLELHCKDPFACSSVAFFQVFPITCLLSRQKRKSAYGESGMLPVEVSARRGGRSQFVPRGRFVSFVV